MKHLYILLLLISSVGFAQIPENYYNYATGTGYTLKTQLKKIIDDNDDPEINNTIEEEHQSQSYNSLDGFNTTYERDYYYDSNGSNTILDIYSEIPNNEDNTPNDPYTFNPGSQECGNYSGEGDCYNKEHVIPQSVFGSQLPMQSDAHHLLPTDGRVNGFRGSFPFGKVDDAQLDPNEQNGITNPTENGSKLGNNLNSGYSAGYTGKVFEPIDEFKGDIARIYFYFATRYEDQISAWSSYPMFNGSSDQVLDNTFLNILMTWHIDDPVSQKEIDRNNNIYYNHQNNRNPFVDHPEWVALIWNPTPDDEAPTDPTNLVASNPTDNSIDLNWTTSTDNIGVASYDIYIDGSNDFNTTNTSFTVSGLTADTNYCFTVKALDASGNESEFSNQACEATTDNGTVGGSDCLVETFENLNTSIGSYTSVSWTGDAGGTWSATDSRTDQNINGTAAITVRNGVLTLPPTSGGIGTLTVTTKRIFGGSSGTFNVNVNGDLVGTINYDDTEQTITIPNINVENSVSVVIDGNSTASNRVMFDDLSYTCYSTLSNDEFNIPMVKIHPNPVRSNLHIDLSDAIDTQIKIYDILGKQVMSKKINNSQAVNVQALKTGVYLLRITQNNKTITKRLVKN